MTQSIYDADTNAEHEGAASKPNTSANTGLTDEGATLRDEESDESSWLLLSHSADARLPRYVPVVDEDELDGNYPKTQGGDVVVRGPIEYDSKAELDLFDAVDDIDGNVPDALPEESVRSVDPMRLPTFEATDDGGETHYSEPPNPYLLDDADERENPYVLAMERGGSSEAKTSDNTSSEKPKARRGRKLWRGIFEQVWLDVEYEILHKKRPEIEESGEADQPNEADGLVEETEQVEEDVSADVSTEEYDEYPEEPEQPEQTYDLEGYDESEEPDQPEEYQDYSEEDLLQDDYLEEENNFEDDEYVEDDAYLVDDEAEAADPESVEELTDDTLERQDESEVFEETSSGDELDAAANAGTAKEARKRIEPPVKVITIYKGAVGAADKVKEFVSVRRARIIVIATATLIILIIIYVAGIARLTGAFLPNTHIGDCDISGMTEHQAEAALTARTKSYALTVSVGDFSTTVDGASVSLDRDEARIAKEAYEKQTVAALSDEQRTELMKQFIWVRHLKYGAAISVCCKLIKREFWAKYQFLFDKNLAIGEDRIFFYSMMQKAGTVSYLNECGYFYRQDPSSATHRYQAGGLPYLIRYLNAFDRDFFAANRALFGREAYRLLTVSWGLTYMNDQNPDSYWTRMKRLSGEVRKDYFREYMRKVECARLSLWKKIEIALLRHGITLTLWIRGLAKNC